MIHPLSMGEIARIRATIRARRAISHPSSDTAAGFLNSLPRRGAADGDCTPRAVGSNSVNERASNGEANGFVGGAQCVRVHGPENACASR